MKFPAIEDLNPCEITPSLGRMARCWCRSSARPLWVRVPQAQPPVCEARSGDTAFDYHVQSANAVGSQQILWNGARRSRRFNVQPPADVIFIRIALNDGVAVLASRERRGPKAMNQKPRINCAPLAAAS